MFMHVSWIAGVANSIKFEPLTNNLCILIPKKFLKPEANFQDLLDFMESRVAPRTRYDIDDILKRYDLCDYQPYAMCRKSHGRKMTDYIWLKFDDEDITYADIKLRD